MEWIMLAIGLGVGAGGGAGVTWWLTRTPPLPAVVVVEDKTAEKQQDVILQVTDQSLLKVACSAEYIATHKSDLLCRELYCRLQSRGIDAKTSQSECEAISNVANKKTIHSFCVESSTTEEGFNAEAQKSCIEFFDRRI